MFHLFGPRTPAFFPGSSSTASCETGSLCTSCVNIRASGTSCPPPGFVWRGFRPSSTSMAGGRTNFWTACSAAPYRWIRPTTSIVSWKETAKAPWIAYCARTTRNSRPWSVHQVSWIFWSHLPRKIWGEARSRSSWTSRMMRTSHSSQTLCLWGSRAKSCGCAPNTREPVYLATAGRSLVRHPSTRKQRLEMNRASPLSRLVKTSKR